MSREMRPIVPEALIHDLAIVLTGSLHPSALIGPSPRLAAQRVADVLGIGEGEMTHSVEHKISQALGR